MKHIFSLFLISILLSYTGSAQGTGDDVGKKPVVIHAESGAVGSNFAVETEGDVTYVTTNVNYTGSSNPQGSESVITYQVTFQTAGTYQLFVRMRVGSNNFDDDSYFSANGFGDKSLTTAADWVMVNGLANAGFTANTAVVQDMGNAGSQVWKWVNVSNNFYPNPATVFTVNENELTVTFQIGSREDGLEFDKIAFGKTDLYFTVESLDNELEGSEEWPGVEVYPGPPLAEGKPKFLGNLKRSGDPSFVKIWNQLTPENEGKWGTVAGTIDTTSWNWSGLDELYAFAKENNILFKNHTLIWGSQQPSWISNLDPDKQLEYIEYWIMKSAQRYPETDMIDVVNEPLRSHNPPDGENGRADYKGALGGDGATGWDWVITSFELARKYFPNTTLILNDYNIINSNSSTTTYIEIINLLNDRGLIDGIGVQGHRFALENTPNSTLNYNLNRLAATGLPIYISELDLGNIEDAGTPDDQVQLELYQRIFPLLWEHPAVEGITLWGFLENAMWQETCFLVRTDGTWRPALTWLEEYVKATPLSAGTEPEVAERIGSELSCFPNPFSTSTKIQFDVEKREHITVKILDSTGKEVKNLVDDRLNPGAFELTWDARDKNGNRINSGLYFCRFIAGERVSTTKLLLIE